MEDKKPAFVGNYGEAKEGDMNPKEEEREAVGLTPEEVREINRHREQSKSKSKSKINTAGNVLAATLTAAGGVGLAATVEGALNSAPAPRVQEQKPDPKRDNPPPGITFSQDTGRKDGGAGEPVLKNRVFMPRVLKDVTQKVLDDAERPPVYLREFGAPERGVIMRNKLEQGGRNLTYVEMGDQELFENMMYLRETYGRPDLKLSITFYSSRLLWERNRSGGKVTVIYWDNWAGDPGIYRNGVQEFYYREADRTLDFRITLPETLPGKISTEDSVNKMHFDFTGLILRAALSQEDGKQTAAYQNSGYREKPEYSDFLAHPTAIYAANPPNILRSALWIKLG